MKEEFKYFVSNLFDIPKFIKTNNSQCEIIKENNGKLVSSRYPAAYPTSGDENLTEIPAEKYAAILKDTINYKQHGK